MNCCENAQFLLFLLIILKNYIIFMKIRNIDTLFSHCHSESQEELWIQKKLVLC